MSIESVSETAGGLADLKNARRRRKPAFAAGLKTDRLPPHSPEAEQGVLGCILLSPNECLPTVIARLKFEAFYDVRHQTIYDALVEMWEAREAIDIITFQQKLKDNALLDEIGGIPYLNALTDSVPSAANLSYYLDIVVEKYLLRKMVQVCTGTVARIYEHEGEVDELIDGIERDILRVSDLRGSEDIKDNKDLVDKAIAAIELFHQNGGKPTGLPTGFPDLDRYTCGLQAGDMIVIGARPSVGKTSLAWQIAEYVAVDLKQPVGVFSLEMTAEALMTRALASRAKVNLRRLTQEGLLTEGDFPRLTSAAGKLRSAPLYIDDTSGLSILALRARARRMHQMFGIKLFVVDYLQLLHSTNKRAENRQQEIADISSGIKNIAKELRVPVIVLSQLNREIEKTKGKPNMSHLRESGAVEQDGDLIGLLYKADDHDEPAPTTPLTEESPEKVNLLIAKQRNGPTGEIALAFFKQYTRFDSLARIADADVPPQSAELFSSP